MFIDLLFTRQWRKGSKCEKLLQQLQTHLKLLKNKKHAVSRILRQDVAAFIRINDYTRALIRTKEIFVAENWISVYDMLLRFTDFILLKFYSIRKQRNAGELLDDKINEAVSSLVFASGRCKELQHELLSIRDIFCQRYGQLYVSTALHLRHGNFVNVEIKEKLSLVNISEDVSARLLGEIAKESGLDSFDTMPLEYYEPEVEKEENKIEEGTPSMEDENIDDAQTKKEEEDEEGRRKRLLPKHVHPKLPDYDQIVVELIRAKNEDEEERRRRLLPKHVHPKLPDYDKIVDKFIALRTQHCNV